MASMVACSTVIPQAFEDKTYLTPIPEATLAAFKYDGLITNKLQAAIVALKSSMGGHFGFNNRPTVISVEKISLTEALRLTKQENYSYNFRNWGSEVWFVVLEGDIQIIPPPPPGGFRKATLPPPFHGCNYEMFDVNYPIGLSATGGFPCATQTP
jgi:hypothetical protein